MAIQLLIYGCIEIACYLYGYVPTAQIKFISMEHIFVWCTNIHMWYCLKLLQKKLD